MVEVVSIADVIEITDEQRTAFTDEGYVVVRNVLDGAARSALAGAIEASRLSPSPHYGVLSAAGTPRVDSDLFRTDLDGIAALSRTSPLPAIAGALLGSSPAVVFVEDQWFASAPGASTMSPWHQDSPYYAIDSPFVTMWCPIDPVPSGAELRVVPGSHLWGKSFAPVAFVAGEGRQTTDEHPLEAVPHITDQMAVAADARAGDVVAFDARLLHSAGGHVDHDFRRFSLRYAAADARYVRPPWPIADFWDELAHGLVDGDALACDAFPLVGG